MAMAAMKATSTDEEVALAKRRARGLPAPYWPAGPEGMDAAYRALCVAPVDELLHAVEDGAERLAHRLAAAVCLALVGDPRIRVDEPMMTLIPGGRTQIGIDGDDVETALSLYARYGVQRAWLEKEWPAFETYVKTFRIGTYPVTNAEYAVFLADSGLEEMPTSWVTGRYPVGAANQPVYSVTPAAADTYARWLAVRTGRAFRLPTEFEWELAAGGPRHQIFPWGDAFAPDHANTLEAGLFMATPVGVFPRGASCFGVYDMSGNVEEYVSNTYAPYPGGRVIEDELYELNPRYRIARGGSFNLLQDMARTTRRHGGPHSMAYYSMGFRLAEDL